MFSRFKKKQKIAEQYKSLKNIGIRLNEIELDQIVSDSQHSKYEEKPYLLLLIDMGSEIELTSGIFTFPSKDIWHFDSECIENHGDYSSVIKRIAELLEDEISINEIKDYVNLENEEVKISFSINKKLYNYELEFMDDWLDLNIFKIFSEILKEQGSERRFYYSDLGQSILVGAYRKDQVNSLNKLINIFLPL
ncbi:hypothetical protein [Paenibacillus planticolens]|uniref:Uncharacterized protein n=1 Tax=Paenibacillus planticolens TaxID=2654976 RepID=A0ABX1ZJ27_9BACL|nr:hypothetical protein [Paenibacillus planticolens]NOU98649.1 hypothetical protein [Paenibacillus planticolens]